VTKAHIAATMREAVSDEAADQIAGRKKQPMAAAAEQLPAATAWLRSLMRTPEPAWLAPEQLEAREAAEAENVPHKTATAAPSPQSERRFTVYPGCEPSM
jgi:ParB family transcriptional regulator, chromosome partitioning protein